MNTPFNLCHCVCERRSAGFFSTRMILPSVSFGCPPVTDTQSTRLEIKVKDIFPTIKKKKWAWLGLVNERDLVRSCQRKGLGQVMSSAELLRE